MSRLNAVAFAPDGSNAAMATASEVQVSLCRLVLCSGFSKACRRGPAPSHFAGRGHSGGGRGRKSVHLFKVSDGTELAAWHEHEGVRALAWSRDGKHRLYRRRHRRRRTS